MTGNHRQYALPALALGALLALALLIPLLKSGTGNGPVLGPWTDVSRLPISRRALAASAANGHLYVLGGVSESGEYLRSVDYATLLPNGRLGPWQRATSLNEGRFYLSAVAVDGYMYAIGGGIGALGDGNIPVATVERAAILPDGQLGPWEYAPELTTARRGLKAVAHEHRIYAIGGYNGLFLKSIESVYLGRGENPIVWKEDPQPSIIDRYIHSATLHDGVIYLLGGHVQRADAMGYADVETSILRTDGSPGPWKVQPVKLLTPRFIAEAFALHDRLFIAGGHDGTRRLNSVEMAQILPDGGLGAWIYSTPLRTARSAAAVAVWDGGVYIIGGISDTGLADTVEYARLHR